MPKVLWRMVVLVVGLLVGLVWLTGCNDNDDNDRNFRAVLSGSQVAPEPVSTNATGTAQVNLRDDRRRLDVTLITTELADVTSAQIRLGAVGDNGPILFNLFEVNGVPFTSPYTIQLRAADLVEQPGFGITSFADAVDAMKDGNTYILITTTANPTGELRGQIGPVQVEADLSGANVVPAVDTAATGTVTARLNDTQTALNVTLQTTGLADTVTGVTIHYGPPDLNGPVLFTLFDSPAGSTLASPLTRRLTENDLTPSGGILTFQDAVNAVLAGNAYLLVTTTTNPSGELRSGNVNAE